MNTSVLSFALGDCTSFTRALENYFADIEIQADPQVMDEVSFFLSNLRWTLLGEWSDNRIAIAYADQIVYDDLAEYCIKNLLKSAIQMSGHRYEIELIPIGELL